MKLIIGGQAVEVPGLDGENFFENPKLKLASTDFRNRRVWWVRSICVHTRMGIFAPDKIVNGGKNRGWDGVVAGRWSKDERYASAHIAIDGDGSVGCLSDLRLHTTYHAGQVNDVSIGIEMYQEADGTIYTDTLASCLRLVDFLTLRFGIQRQIPAERKICRRFARGTKGSGSAQRAYLSGGLSGVNFSGVFGHRNVTRNRGPGDPGDEIMAWLSNAGYERYIVDLDEDLNVWAGRQRQLGIHEEEVDGIPGSQTLELLRKKHSPTGLWVPRPGDE